MYPKNPNKLSLSLVAYLNVKESPPAPDLWKLQVLKICAQFK